MAQVVFCGVFTMIGLGVLYAGLREKHLRHCLSVGGGKVALSKQVFGKPREKSLASHTLTSVSLKEFYRQNYQPVYGIEIKGPDRKIHGDNSWGQTKYNNERM
jgi:hypothetical protein